MDELALAAQWIALGQQVLAGGQAAWDSIKSALRDHGIEADNTALDNVIGDAMRRKAIAQAEAERGDSDGA